MTRVEKDFTSDPAAFAAANEAADLRYLRSLTMESAARALERILELQAEIVKASAEMGNPPQIPNPLPGPSLAILLEGKPSDEP